MWGDHGNIKTIKHFNLYDLAKKYFFYLKLLKILNKYRNDRNLIFYPNFSSNFDNFFDDLDSILINSLKDQ